VAIDDLEAHENAVEMQRLQEAEEEAMIHMRNQAHLVHIEGIARQRLQEIWDKHQKEAATRELQRVEAHEQRKNIMQQAFNRCEENLRVALERREAEVRTYYGDLTNTEALDRQLKGRHFALDWARAPQPWELRIHALRGVRNKLPAGHYTLRVTIYDQMAGIPLSWTKLGTQGEEQWNVATDPRKFGQGFEIEFNQSLHTASVAPIAMKPSMCLVFQLFLLKATGGSQKTKEVGWSAFPMCDSKFQPVNGKFKVPMLRGKKDVVVDKYGEIQDIITHDIDNWLGNLYFEARHLERYIDGHREFDVELEFTSSLLEMAEQNEQTHEYKQMLAQQAQADDDAAGRQMVDSGGESGAKGGKRRRMTNVLSHPGWLKPMFYSSLPYMDT